MSRKYNVQWRSISYPQFVGTCSKLFQDFYSSWNSENYPNVQDFADFYFDALNPDDEDGIARMNSVNYGRSARDLKELAEYYKSLCHDSDLPLEDFYDDIIAHVIVETFHGQMREILLCDTYTSKGYSVERTSGYWDIDLGVDAIIRKNGKIVDYIQLKPISTFLGVRNASLIQDRQAFYRKEKKKKKECEKNGFPYKKTKFVLYNTKYPTMWCCKDGKKSFLLEELCDENGIPLVKDSDFSYVSAKLDKKTST